MNESEGYVLDILLETLNKDMEMEEDYLEIIDDLLSNKEELTID
tara:strand:- start:309 stop:440 length:132 start_codon:yes stop_codon:yes gene_type:complete